MDKLGIGFHGDPAAALLEVLDPEQRRSATTTFPFPSARPDGSHRDARYIEDEKLAIAKRHLIKRQFASAAPIDEQCQIEDECRAGHHPRLYARGRG
jgi:ATP-dependent Lon protease